MTLKTHKIISSAIAAIFLVLLTGVLTIFFAGVWIPSSFSAVIAALIYAGYMSTVKSVDVEKDYRLFVYALPVLFIFAIAIHFVVLSHEVYREFFTHLVNTLEHVKLPPHS